jgi:hypothetical protein
MQCFSFGGYDPKIFNKPVNQDFFCPICSCREFVNLFYIDVVKKPKECTVCGTLCCEICIKIWSEKNRNNF